MHVWEKHKHDTQHTTKRKYIHGNTCMHYLALFDEEDFIEAIINKISWNPAAIPELRVLADTMNNEGRNPLDHFFVGKADSYELLHHFLTE